MPSQISNMGFQFGLESNNTRYPQKFRWLFNINGVSGQNSTNSGVYALPPYKSSRPNFEFKTIELKHITERVARIVRPEFKSINLTLYDIKSSSNPVFEWLRGVYDASTGVWTAPGDVDTNGIGFYRQGKLTLYDGCGCAIQEISFDNCFPQSVNWGELDMSDSSVVMVDMTLNYDRAYFKYDNVVSDSSGTVSG